MRVKQVPLALALVVAGLISSVNAAAAAPSMAALPNLCQAPVDLTQPTSSQATVTQFVVGNHEPAFDRVVIGLNRPAANYRVRYVPQIIQDGSGLPVPLRGTADIEVVIDGATAHNAAGQPTVPNNYNRNWRSLLQAKLVSDFEGTVAFGIGVSQRVDFRTFTLSGPHRLVIDLAMPGQHPWNCRSGAVKTFFLNQPRYVNNTPPFFTPVWRRVQAPALASGALSSLFHGPTPTEYKQGLRFVSSEASGFAALSISSSIARLRLTGGCNSGGSTVTVAGEIMPTLKQFPSVRNVKIFSPSGQTAYPTGPIDSVPDCLQP